MDLLTLACWQARLICYKVELLKHTMEHSACNMTPAHPDAIFVHQGEQYFAS